MDWAMLGAIGEILGAVGVIATLGYLASQIRGNTLAAQSRAAGELFDQNQAFFGADFGQPGVCCVVAEGDGGRSVTLC